MVKLMQKDSFECNMCGTSNINVYCYKDTYIYSCTECPNVQCEFNDYCDIDNFKEFMCLSEKERKKYIHLPYAYSFDVETSDREFVVVSDKFNTAIEVYNIIANGRKYKSISSSIKPYYIDDKEV